MGKYKWKIILLNLLFLVGYMAWAVCQKEKTIREGQLVLLELVPVDPRSLMQGDYMRLGYDIHLEGHDADEVIPEQGIVIVEMDSCRVGYKFRLAKQQQVPGENEVRLKYRNTSGTFTIGAESYFFQEGQDSVYVQARYGGMRVDEKGNSVLFGLYDGNRKLITGK